MNFRFQSFTIVKRYIIIGFTGAVERVLRQCFVNVAVFFFRSKNTERYDVHTIASVKLIPRVSNTVFIISLQNATFIFMDEQIYRTT